MSPYTFRAVFSGPCAYVPNRIVSSGTTPASWSAIMPQLNIGRSVGGVAIAPHYAVLQYPTGLFDADFQPDVVFQRAGGPELAVVLLASHRIRIQTTEKPPFSPRLCSLPDAVLAAGGDATTCTCLDFLPPMERLLPGASVIGRADRDLFDPTTGLPNEDIAAHTVLDQGNLVTDSLVPKNVPSPGPTPPIWRFRVQPGPSQPAGPDVAMQAVAYTVALELDGLSNPLQIVIENANGQRKLRLRSVPLPAAVEIEINNREFDEIVGLATGSIAVGDIDSDFKALYFLSGTEKGATPLPDLFRDGGAGTRRATCGGADFLGFQPGFETILTQW